MDLQNWCLANIKETVTEQMLVAVFLIFIIVIFVLIFNLIYVIIKYEKKFLKKLSVFWKLIFRIFSHIRIYGKALPLRAFQ